MIAAFAICLAVNSLPLPTQFAGLPISTAGGLDRFWNLSRIGNPLGRLPGAPRIHADPGGGPEARMIRHLFSEALSALAHYRLRSALTMLSIVWGVASLTLLLSYGEGFERALTQAFLQIGKDLIVVFPGQTSMQAGGERSGRRIRLELSDVKAIQEGVPTVEAVSPEVRRNYPMSFNVACAATMSARLACSEQIRNAAVASARYLSDEDVLIGVAGCHRRSLRHDCSAASQRRKRGQDRRCPFTVVGVIEKKTQISNTGPDDMTLSCPSHARWDDRARYLNNIVLLPASNQFGTHRRRRPRRPRPRPSLQRQ